MVVVVVVVGGGTHRPVLCELSVISRVLLQASTARSSVLRVTWHVAYVYCFTPVVCRSPSVLLMYVVLPKWSAGHLACCLCILFYLRVLQVTWQGAYVYCSTRVVCRSPSVLLMYIVLLLVIVLNLY